MYYLFVEATWVSNDTDGGTVEILGNDIAVEKLFVVSGLIINTVEAMMRTSLTQYGVKLDGLPLFVTLSIHALTY